MALELQKVTKKYGPQTALNEISLRIGKNEIIGLLGPNGAGKSTLMKCITGVTVPDSGDIFFDGKNIRSNPAEIKRNIGFLPENNPLYTDMFVREFLSFAAKLHAVPKERIDDVISLVGLTPEKSKKISQLSKGYRQRAGLAAAILHRPDLLILDEPTNGLDPNQIIEIRQLIRDISKDKTVLLSTHIMQEVEALCTRVILIHRGEIRQDSAVEDFKGRYSSIEEAFSVHTA